MGSAPGTGTGSQAEPAPTAAATHRSSKPGPGSHLLLVAALGLLGFLLSVGYAQVHGHALAGIRSPRKVRLVELIDEGRTRAERLRQEISRLQEKSSRLSAATRARQVRLGDVQRDIEELAKMGGLVAMSGPGIEVVLSDSLLRSSPSGDLNDLVIHEQDIQVVVNALWAGGAEAVAVNGERLISTSAIRCVGNTLLLNGSVHSPPYRIQAIGETRNMRRSLDTDPLVAQFTEAADRYRLGYEISPAAQLDVAAYEGSPRMRYATVARGGE